MTDENKKEPAKKLRELVNGGEAVTISKLPKKDASDVSFLPKLAGGQEEDASFTSADAPQTLPKNVPVSSGLKNSLKTSKPGFKLPKLNLNLGKSKSKAVQSVSPVNRSKFKLNFGPAFWTTASIISLTVNLILIIVLLLLALGFKRSGLGIASLANLGNNLLGGLYGNFEKMDRAKITTDVQVNTTIPVKFDLQLNQQTNVVLSQDVTITNALVTVNTGGLNITRANTTIVLPQGTTLPVVLNLTVPVDTTVPVALNVPVNIPLSQTELHEPFAGLQDVVRPFYCLINSAAVNLDGARICP